MLVTQELLKSPDPGYAKEPQMELGDSEPSENLEKEQGAETAMQQGSNPPQLAMEEENRSHGVQSLVDQEEEKVEGEEKEKVDEKEEDVGKQKESVHKEEEKTVQNGKVDAEEEKMDEDEDKVDGEEEDEDAADHSDDFSELLLEVMRLLSPEKGGWR